jgi:hypothetical protein
MFERLTSRQTIKHADDTEHIETYCHGHRYGPAAFPSKYGTSNPQEYKNYCEMVDRLAAYEDTGLTPEQIQSQQQEIERLNKVLDDWKYNAKCDADHIAGLLADKDEQAGRIMRMDYLLRRTLPILEATNNQQELIEAIDALLGGAEDG